jgi:Cys-rich protein (TIGR01571 family)
MHEFKHEKLLKQFFLCELCMEMLTACAVSGVVYCLMMHVACTPCYSCSYQKKLCAKFNLEEDPCGDCIVHCFCEHCALCQEYRELKNKGLDPALGNIFRYM